MISNSAGCVWRLLVRGDEEANLSHNIYKLGLVVLDPLAG